MKRKQNEASNILGHLNFFEFFYFFNTNCNEISCLLLKTFTVRLSLHFSKNHIYSGISIFNMIKIFFIIL